MPEADDAKAPLTFRETMQYCGFYFFCAGSMNFINKAVLSSYGFKAVFTLVLLQRVMTLTTLRVLKDCGFIDFPEFSFKIFRSIAPLSIVDVLNVAAGMIGLGLVSIPGLYRLLLFPSLSSPPPIPSALLPPPIPSLSPALLFHPSPRRLLLHQLSYSLLPSARLQLTLSRANPSLPRHEERHYAVRPHP